MWDNSSVQRRKPVSERFWEKVYLPPCEDDCWRWMAKKVSGGYGVFFPPGNRVGVLAHRWAYEQEVAPIPQGLTLDHLCRTPGCVNPAHLEPVTIRENILRGMSPTAICARQTTCLRGHSFDAANTYIDKRGARICRACDCLRHAKHRRQKQPS